MNKPNVLVETHVNKPGEIDFDDLDSSITDLIKLANDARADAHVPYTRFAIGAAVLSEDDRMFTGCNVENSFPSLTICAERAALTNAIGEGAKRFKAIAVVAKASPGRFTIPCGACRQFFKEFDKTNKFVVYCARPDDNTKAFRATTYQLLPF